MKKITFKFPIPTEANQEISDSLNEALDFTHVNWEDVTGFQTDGKYGFTCIEPNEHAHRIYKFIDELVTREIPFEIVSYK